MKRLTKLYTLIALIAILVIPAATYANTLDREVSVFIDGKPVEFTQDLGYPTVINGRTLVPIRIISENMGYEVDWSKDTWDKGVQKIWIKGNGTTIELEVGKSTALVNGNRVPIDTKEDGNGNIVPVDTKTLIIGNRTYVPIRFISENMGATVDWKIEGKTLFVYIVRPGTIPSIPDVGTIPGNADYSENGYKENIEKIGEFFGSALDETMSSETGASFSPIKGGTDSMFLYVVNGPGEKYEAKVVVKNWYFTSDIGTPMEKELKKIPPTVKEVLRFYLPDGYEKLYKIVDDGFNNRLDDMNKYINKDISKLIGSDRRVEIVDGAGGLHIEIGTGK